MEGQFGKISSFLRCITKTKGEVCKYNYSDTGFHILGYLFMLIRVQFFFQIVTELYGHIDLKQSPLFIKVSQF